MAQLRHRVNVVTYNVLSSHLCEPEYFVHCSPENLDPAVRLPRVKKKLQTFMEKNSVICLQELSQCWVGDLHVWFQRHEYTLINANYGKTFNGYMGVAIAYPQTIYDLKTCDIERVTDTKDWSKFDPVKPEETVITKATTAVMSGLRWLVSNVYPLASPQKPSANDDPWNYSRSRFNLLITLGLSPRKAKEKQFFVSTYHMPCAFFAPRVMMVHSALAAQHAQRIAKQSPLILCGDWNFQPNTSQYALITTGKASKDEPDYFDTWRCTQLEPMNSAYSTLLGKEPSFTNYSQTIRDKTPFSATLDYIFLSKDIKVHDVENLPKSLESFPGSLPVETEPSDHLLLAATVDV
eukprot:m.53339 g.53339  ORF g.53339 m.53339 type:complete len:350 (+) comp10860_c0_seq1:192-1241(+)